MGEYEQKLVGERANRKKWGYAQAGFIVGSIASVPVSERLLGRSVLIPILGLFVVGPLAAWGYYRWFEPARDWVVLQAYRLRGRL